MSHDRSTRNWFRSLLTLALFVWAAPASAVAAEMWDAIPPNPNVDFVYVLPKSAKYQATYEALKQRQTLEELQHFVSPLRLPHHLRVQTEECNQINAFYSPFDRSLTLCYELVADFVDHAPKTVSPDGFVTRATAIFGSVIGVLLHEGGHMMFDMFDVPRFGREEDAADENAAFVALQFNQDVARSIVKGFAYAWMSGRDPRAMSAFSNEHGTDSQRLYNTLCLGYGGDPKTFGGFVERGLLPKARAAGCAEEYNQLKFAWLTTIYPFVDQKLVERVQQAQWLTPEELR